MWRGAGGGCSGRERLAPTPRYRSWRAIALFDRAGLTDRCHRKSVCKVPTLYVGRVGWNRERTVQCRFLSAALRSGSGTPTAIRTGSTTCAGAIRDQVLSPLACVARHPSLVRRAAYSCGVSVGCFDRARKIGQAVSPPSRGHASTSGARVCSICFKSSMRFRTPAKCCLACW